MSGSASDDILEAAAKRQQRKVPHTSTGKDDLINEMTKVSLRGSNAQVSDIPDFGSQMERPRTSRRARSRTADNTANDFIDNSQPLVPFLLCRCQNQDLRTMVDSSSPVSFINKDAFLMCGYSLDQMEKVAFISSTNPSLKIIGRMKNIPVTVGEKELMLDVFVTESGPDLCFGVDILTTYRGVLNFAKRNLTISGHQVELLTERDVPLRYRTGKPAASM
ncbi:uncharacterized protein LOC106173111 [Lingula anatina]|uniref:Uncharacterized protein LOC106173111 n=1 Tax=Lingula anatina TaxID=7574 RepID=A0A1S3JGN1_LINAN|nr:uncharacterized protein LOC106173111 [Lingula anatina]|eukprot:XP_013409565.1 uncharacterized protein LOC106173111 [Lingula anatina]